MIYSTTENSRTILILVAISSVTLSMLVVGVANSFLHSYEYVYAAANNSTTSASSASSSQSTSPSPPEMAKIHFIIVDKAYWSWGHSPALENTVIHVYDESEGGKLIKQVVPSMTGGNHYYVDNVPVGHKIKVTSNPLERELHYTVDGAENLLYTFDQTYLITGDKICGTVGIGYPNAAICTIEKMPASGLDIVNGVHHACSGGGCRR